jgi:hypothetical protein
MGENGGGGMGENEREGRETGRDCVGEGVLGRKREGVLSACRRVLRWAFGVYWLLLSSCVEVGVRRVLVVVVVVVH